MYIGNGTNGLWFSCTPVITDKKVDLAVNGKVVDGEQKVISTNQFRASASAENFGGMLIRVENMDGLTASNLVAVIGVQIVTNITAGHFQQRLVPLGKQVWTLPPSSAEEMVQNAKLFYEMGKLDEAAEKLKAALAVNPENATALYYSNLVVQEKQPRSSTMAAGQERKSPLAKLDQIRLDHFFCDYVPLEGVLRQLTDEVRQRDPEKTGVIFRLDDGVSTPANRPAIDPATGLLALATIDPLTGLPMSATAATNDASIHSIIVVINPGRHTLRLSDALDAIVAGASKPIRYSLLADGSVVFAKGLPPQQLFMRTFRVDAEDFYAYLQTHGGRQTNGIVQEFLMLFSKLGVDLSPSTGNAIFYKGLGYLFVKATKSDLDAIEREIESINRSSPQNQLAQLPNEFNHATGILNDSNYRAALRELQQRTGIEKLSEPQVTTSSGRGINKISMTNISVPRPNFTTLTKLDRIRLEHFSTGVSGMTLIELLKQLTEQTKLRDSDGKGITFLINSNRSDTADTTESQNIDSVIIKIPSLTDVRLTDLLDAIVLVADQPIRYGILADGSVAFFPKVTPKSEQLLMRTFRVDPNTFYRGLENSSDGNANGQGQFNLPQGPTRAAAPEPSVMARAFFAKLGIDFEQPPGKAIFFNDRLGYLFVKATESDLDTIERAIQVLNQAPPQIHSKARFIEVLRGTPFDFQLFSAASNSAAQLTGILNATNARAALRALQARSGIETLGEPEVTTTSGRQTQMRVTDVVTVVTNLTFQDTFTNQDGALVTNAIVPQTSKFETGPVLDVVPYVLSDGYTINLALIPSLTEFLGYDKSTNTTAAHNRAGEKINVPEVLPRFTVRQVAATLNLWDGQTAVLGGLPVENYVNGVVVKRKTTASGKELVIFVTATIVDPAGNRVHSDDELLF